MRTTLRWWMLLREAEFAGRDKYPLFSFWLAQQSSLDCFVLFCHLALSMPESLLCYVIAKVELLPDPMQESCACADAFSLMLVLLVATVIAGEESDLLSLTSWSFSNLMVQERWSNPSKVDHLPTLLSSSLLGQLRRLSITQDGSLNAFYLKGHLCLHWD